MTKLEVPVDLIWGEKDPWEPIQEAKKWFQSFECIKSLSIIDKAGHCPHDEMPEQVNPILEKIIQETILVPRLQGEAMGLSPAVMLLSISVWGKILGFLGLIMALPLTCLGLTYYRRHLLRKK